MAKITHLIIAFLAVTTFLPAKSSTPDDIALRYSTLQDDANLDTQEAERAKFFDDFYRKTLHRSAYARYQDAQKKWNSLEVDGFNDEVNRQQLRQEFIEANTNTKIIRATLKLNNARKDRHLKAEKKLRGKNTYAPIKFYPDFSDHDKPFLFVANYSPEQKKVNLNDKLIAINGIPINEYINILSPYLRYSTKESLYFKELPKYLSARNTVFGPELYLPENRVTYTLKNSSTQKKYSISLRYNYKRRKNIAWRYDPILGRNREKYEEDKRYVVNRYQSLGFMAIYEHTQDFSLYINKRKKITLLEWYHFDDTSNSVSQLLKVAQENNILHYDLIIDLTHSGGGRKSQILLRALADKPFKMTFSNLRVDDRDFIERNIKTRSNIHQKWVNTAINRKWSFTSNQPFKLINSRLDSNGILKPKKRRFTGRKVALFFPLGGSSLDQFASMIVDNPEVGIHTIGMPTGGFSNSWQWGEALDVPGIGPIFFEWSVGQTIRPNGEVLEGNPAQPKQIIPFTADNYKHYFSLLINEAIKHLR